MTHYAMLILCSRNQR